MANKVFRFALGSAADPRSGRWRAWTHEDEVHLGVQATHAELHLIAYPTGRWRITIGDAVSKWTRPKEFRPGWTRGPDILIPFRPGPVRLPETDPFAHEPIAWLPAPAPGFAACFSLLLASRRAEESQWRPQDAPGTLGLAILPLRTIGALHLNRLDGAMDPVDAPISPSAEATGFEVLVSADHTGRPTLRVSPTP
jgi:hypothetical protein